MAKVNALLSLLLFAAAASTVRSQYETINFDYDFNGVPPTTLTLQGAAQFIQNNPNLTLTPGTTDNEVGRVLHTAPVPIETADRTLISFYSTIKFFITPKNDENTPADGIAFFIAPVGTTIPAFAFGGSLGVFNTSYLAPNTVVVEFDTSVNNWDPNYQHIGIDVGTIISSNVTNMYGLLGGREVTAEISFTRSPESRLTVRVLLGRGYEVSTTYPLSTFLTDEVQFGLSASTSNRLARQDIVSWHNNYTVAVAVAPQIQEVVVSSA